MLDENRSLVDDNMSIRLGDIVWVINFVVYVVFKFFDVEEDIDSFVLFKCEVFWKCKVDEMILVNEEICCEFFEFLL